MKKRVLTLAAAVSVLAGMAVAQTTTGYLYYAAGVSGDDRTEADGLGVLDAGGTNPNADAMFPNVLVADVTIDASSVTVENWRYAAAYGSPLNNPIPLDNPNTTGTTENYSWIYVSHNVHVYDGYLYVGPGDWNGDTNFDTAPIVAYAPINSDGTLGAWDFSDVMPTELAINASALVDVDGEGGELPYLYVMGSIGSANVHYAQIQAGGGLGAWQTGQALPDGADWFHGGVGIGDKAVYLSGNLIGTPPKSYYSTIGSGGSMGSWTSIGDFSNGDESGTRWAYAVGALETPAGTPYLAVTCGNGVADDDGVYTSVLTGGVPQAWTTQAAVVPNPVRNVSGVGVGDVFFVVGGATANTAGASVDTVRVGRIDNSGVITWTDSDTEATIDALPMTRSYGGVAFQDNSEASVDTWSIYAY